MCRRYCVHCFGERVGFVLVSVLLLTFILWANIPIVTQYMVYLTMLQGLLSRRFIRRRSNV